MSLSCIWKEKKIKLDSEPRLDQDKKKKKVIPSTTFYYLTNSNMILQLEIKIRFFVFKNCDESYCSFECISFTENVRSVTQRISSSAWVHDHNHSVDDENHSLRALSVVLYPNLMMIILTVVYLGSILGPAINWHPGVSQAGYVINMCAIRWKDMKPQDPPVLLVGGR